MSEGDVMTVISAALSFCHSHYCMGCPKFDACSMIFNGGFIESEIYDLAVRCSEFIAMSDDEGECKNESAHVK